MPKSKKRVNKNRVVEEEEVVESEVSRSSLKDTLESELKSSYSYVNLILGLLIVLVVGVLLFNYFKNDSATPASSDEANSGDQIEGTQSGELKDAEVGNLPGQYTVKVGDTLFTIAQKYYNDGYKYTELVTANNLPNENAVEVGQVLIIPKLDVVTPMVTTEPTKAPEVMTTPAGQNISGDTYTVEMGDSLKSIAARAYGDENQYTKIAEANKISNPDQIEVGQVLKLPR